MNALFSAATMLLAAGPAALSSPLPPPAPPLSPVPPLSPAPVRAETLRLKFAAGQTLFYRLSEDTDGAYAEPHGKLTPIKSHLELAQTQTVSDLRPADGAGLVDAGLRVLALTVDGTPEMGSLSKDALASLETLPVIAKLVVLPNGKLLETRVNPNLNSDEALTGEDPAHMNALAGLGELPAAPVSVGSRWKSAVFLGLTGEQSTADLTLTGWDTKGGVKDGDAVAVITQVIHGTFGTPAAVPPQQAAPAPRETKSADNSPAPEAEAVPKKEGDLRIKGWLSGTRTVHLNLALGCAESMESHVYMTVLLTSRDIDGKFSGPPTRMWVQVTSKLIRTDKPAEKPAPPSSPK